MSKLVLAVFLAAATGAAAALWWADRAGDSTVAIAPSEDGTATESCDSCSARHQRLTKPETEDSAE